MAANASPAISLPSAILESPAVPMLQPAASHSSLSCAPSPMPMMQSPGPDALASSLYQPSSASNINGGLSAAPGINLFSPSHIRRTNSIHINGHTVNPAAGNNHYSTAPSSSITTTAATPSTRDVPMSYLASPAPMVSTSTSSASVPAAINFGLLSPPMRRGSTSQLISSSAAGQLVNAPLSQGGRRKDPRKPLAQGGRYEASSKRRESLEMFGDQANVYTTTSSISLTTASGPATSMNGPPPSSSSNSNRRLSSNFSSSSTSSNSSPSKQQNGWHDSPLLRALETHDEEKEQRSSVTTSTTFIQAPLSNRGGGNRASLIVPDESAFAELALKSAGVAAATAGIAHVGTSNPFNECEMHEILPKFLYLGGIKSAHDINTLRGKKIKYIVNATVEVANRFESAQIAIQMAKEEKQVAPSPPVQPGEFVYRTYALKDDASVNIMSVFEDFAEFIHNVKQANDGGILVHCLAGMSRSVSLVIAWLMRGCGMPLVDSFWHVKDRRQCAYPNAGFLQQLQKYELRIFAKSSLDPRHPFWPASKHFRWQPVKPQQ
jgi:hypothetical protein